MSAALAVGPVPEAPRTTPDTAMLPERGSTIFVSASGDLQAAIHEAKCGDTAVLQAGATYTGTFVLLMEWTHPGSCSKR
jgi:hypothetical protein